MVIFLTSSFIKYQTMEEYVPTPIEDANGFCDNLRKYWKEDTHFLVFSSDPYDEIIADHVTDELYNAFTLSDFSIGGIRCFDERSIQTWQIIHKCDYETAAYEALKEDLIWADVLFVAGGHAPTENVFMKNCRLKDLLHQKEVFDGIYIGLSAGSLNAASESYLIPELPGESDDQNYTRFTEGLGLTQLNIFPHSQYYSTITLDGKDIVDEIVAPDSSNREIYMIPDGAYFIIRKGVTEFFGEGEIMENGKTRTLHAGIINNDRQTLFLKEEAPKDMAKLLDEITSDYFDWVLKLDPRDGSVEFFQISHFMLEHGIIPVNIDSFWELCQLFSEKLVVQDERQAVLDQLDMAIIMNEIAKTGCYVRTIHIDSESGIQAKNIRIKPIANNSDCLLVHLTDISLILDHDWMTDQYSRSGFLAQATKFLKNPEVFGKYSVVYTNVQGFKAVNELLGSFHGDMLIFHVRDWLIEIFDPTLIARLESDHFAIITRTDKLTDKNLQAFCNGTYQTDSISLPVHIHCGICHITDPSKKIVYMLDHAKLAENSIPCDHGVPYAICDETMRDNYVNQRIYVSELDKALENNEFLTYYQPVVDAKTGKIVSAEALIRWNHYKKGMIPPGQFVPIFEKEGLITKLDNFMVNSVLQFNLKRMKQGLSVVPCAVNLSRVDFYDSNLLELLEKELAKHDHIQDMLKLEVTESAYAVLESNAISFLERMHSLGLSLLLDDFGSGMSSLSTLESFEFDIIKLDMGFIRKIGKSRNAEAIIKHTIGLSHDIGAKVVAEGVETKDQVDFLKKAGCDMIQGYYFYKPMPEDEFEKLL